jgi:hypothetical protein
MLTARAAASTSPPQFGSSDRSVRTPRDAPPVTISTFATKP